MFSILVFHDEVEFYQSETLTNKAIEWVCGLHQSPESCMVGEYGEVLILKVVYAGLNPVHESQTLAF